MTVLWFKLRTRCKISKLKEYKYVTRLNRKSTFPIRAMGVTMSVSKRERKQFPKPSFASFSTTGTLTSSADEGELSGIPALLGVATYALNASKAIFVLC